MYIVPTWRMERCKNELEWKSEKLLPCVQVLCICGVTVCPRLWVVGGGRWAAGQPTISYTPHNCLMSDLLISWDRRNNAAPTRDVCFTFCFTQLLCCRFCGNTRNNSTHCTALFCSVLGSDAFRLNNHFLVDLYRGKDVKITWSFQSKPHSTGSLRFGGLWKAN